MTRVCAVAGFGAPNYGDLLYAFVMQGLMRPRCDAEFFGLPSRLAAPVVPMRRLAALHREEPQAVVVGGGDILRCDWRAVAGDHVGRHRDGRVARATDRLRTARYLRRELGFSSPGPFVVDPRSFRSAPRVAYVSCSVPGPVPTEQAPDFAAALDGASFLAVRDERSRTLLLEAGVRPDLPTVAPDVVLALGALLPREHLLQRGAELLEKAGVPVVEEPFAFHLTPWLLSDERAVRRLLSDLAGSGRRIVGLPMGAYVDEHAFLDELLAGVEGAVVLPVLDITGIAAVLACAAGAVVSSFHAGITAGVYGRSVAFVPGAARKAEGLMASLAADGSRHIASSWDDPLLRSPEPFDPVSVQRAADAATAAVGQALEAVVDPAAV